MITQEELDACAHHSNGDWDLCVSDTHFCGRVGAKEHPVCTVEYGEWGDSYPALRVTGNPGSVGDGSIHVEPYMEFMAYGSIPHEVSVANGRLIALAPKLRREYMALMEEHKIVLQMLAEVHRDIDRGHLSIETTRAITEYMNEV